jgi:hypothetical protein
VKGKEMDSTARARSSSRCASGAVKVENETAADLSVRNDAVRLDLKVDLADPRGRVWIGST